MKKQELIEKLRLEIKKPANQHTRSFPLWITKEQATDLLRVLEGNWISVDERLPDRNIEVLVLRSKPFWHYLRTAFVRDGLFISSETAKEVEKVTHWMPLPKPLTNKHTCKCGNKKTLQYACEKCDN